MNYKTVFASLIAAMLLLSVFAPTAIAAADFNESATAAQNPFISTDVTIAEHDRESMSPGQYEADDGSIKSLPATIDRSEDIDDIGSGTVNPYHFVATDIAFKDAGAFPHGEENVSAVDNESAWTSTSAVTVSDAETAPGVEAVEVSSSGVASGSTETATFSDVSVTSDVEKRYLQAALDVESLDSGATVEVRAVDTDGDYVAGEVNASATASDEHVIATGTGEGYVYQHQIGQMPVQGSGDGVMNEIDSIEVAVSDADATVRLSALNAEKTGEWTFGDERVNTDDEDDFETETITEVSEPGQIQIYDMDTMGSAFGTAVIHGLEMPMRFAAADLGANEQDVNVTFVEATSYPSFDNRMEAHYRLTLPDAYDLSYSDAALKQDVTVPNSRYQSVEIAEGASDTDFDDIDGWTDLTGSIGTVGDTVTLDDTIQPGQEIAVHESVLVTSEEMDEVQQIGGVGQFGDSGGGLLDTILSPLGGLAAAVGAVLARIRGMI